MNRVLATGVIGFLLTLPGPHIEGQAGSSGIRGPYFGQSPPGDHPEVFADGILEHSHSAPAFSPDGRHVFWCSKRDPNRPGYEVLHMHNENGTWSAPEYVCKGFNPFLSVDGEHLYYVSRGLLGSRHLKTRTITDEGLSNARKTGSPLRSKHMMWNPTIAADGTIYLCMFDDDYRNYHEYRLFRSSIMNGRYTDIRQLSEAINGEGATSPFIAPDRSYLIFGSHRPGGVGDEDLYISYRKPDGDWTEPVNLGNRINTSGFEDYPRVSPDGRYLFFLRGGHVYWVSTDFIERLKPEHLK
ncbi:hypothetical protein ACFL6T_06155 [Candidatus Zixiibacteriota bacterium]